MQSLTKRQQEIFSYVCACLAENKVPPSIPEIAEKFSLKSCTVWCHLHAIQQRGYLSRANGNHRGLQLVETMRSSPELLSVEIPFLMRRAGRGIDTRKRIRIDRKMLPPDCECDNLFAFRVTFSCITVEQINLGDILVVMRNPANLVPGMVVLCNPGRKVEVARIASDGILPKDIIGRVILQIVSN